MAAKGAITSLSLCYDKSYHTIINNNEPLKIKSRMLFWSNKHLIITWNRYFNKTAELEFSSINKQMFTSQQTLKLCSRLTSFSCVEMFILLNFVVSVLNTRLFCWTADGQLDTDRRHFGLTVTVNCRIIWRLYLTGGSLSSSDDVLAEAVRTCWCGSIRTCWSLKRWAGFCSVPRLKASSINWYTFNRK